MDFLDLIRIRESCRSYAKKPVDTKLLKDLADTARFAPSARNAQPWHLYIVNRPEPVAKVTEAVTVGGRNVFAPEIPAYIIVTKPGPRVEPAAESVYVHPYGDFDCGAVSNYLTLAAAERGLSTCMLGWFDDEILREVCGYGDESAVIVMAVGYSSGETPRPKDRKRAEEILTVI